MTHSPERVSAAVKPGPLLAVPLDSPRSFAGLGVGVGPAERFVVAVAVRGEPLRCDDAGGVGVNDGGGDPISVGVDANDMVDQFCKHGDGASL